MEISTETWHRALQSWKNRLNAANEEAKKHIVLDDIDRFADAHAEAETCHRALEILRKMKQNGEVL